MTTPVPPATPFITPTDVHAAGSEDPLQIGQMKLNQLIAKMDMSDADVDALAAEIKLVKSTYQAWADFKSDLDLRKKRYLGFQAVTLALDVTQAAAAMHTTPAAVNALMNGAAQQEGARIAELEAMWQAGQLPDKAVLSDPSKQILS